MIHQKLYNIDVKGKVRVWFLESNDTGYRTISGLVDGKQVTSGWVKTEPKNVGKKNATTSGEQALAEVEANYTKKIEKKYYPSLEEAKTGGQGTKFFSPMLATKWADMKSKITLPFWTQPKLDGIRFTSSQEASLSRGGKPFPVVSHIVDALAPAFASFPGLRLDGELYNHKLKEDFNQITSLVKQMKPKKEDFEKAAALVEYHVYDIPSHPGTFSERIHFLEHEVMPHISDKRIVLVETCPVSSIEALDELYGRWLSEGYEGQMIRTDAVYQSGPKRDGRLIKRKEFMDAEYPVIRIESGVGDWTGVAKSVICSNGEREFGAGIKGTVENGRKLLAGPLPKFATVRYPNLTPDGVPRFGIAVEFFNEERTS